MAISQLSLDARHAAALHLLIGGRDLSELNGHVVGSLVKRGFLTDRVPNAAGRDWLSRYSGRSESPSRILRPGLSPRKPKAAAGEPAGAPVSAPETETQRKIKAIRASFVLQKIIDSPGEWLFLDRRAAVNTDLESSALGVLAYLCTLRGRAPADVSLHALIRRFPEIGVSGVRRIVSQLQAAGYAVALTE